MTVDNLYIEKQKAEKNEKSKKPNKGKGKAKLKVEGDNVSKKKIFIYKINFSVSGPKIADFWGPQIRHEK